MRCIDGALSPTDLPKRTREQLIKRGDDCIAVLGKRPDTFAQILVSNRNNLHRVQYDRDTFDPEGRIKARIGYLAELGFAHERNHDAAAIAIE